MLSRMAPTQEDNFSSLEPGKNPKAFKAYRLTLKETELTQEKINEQIKKGYIRESKSLAAYPILFANKKDETLRMCVDYRHLNRITIKDKFPLSLIKDILDRISLKKWITKYDIPNAYYRLFRIKYNNKQKTGFITPEGHYEFIIILFGLINAVSHI